MYEQPFIGMGRNPEGADLPLGLGLHLMQHPSAKEAFGQMSPAQKERLIRYLQSADNGEEAERLMNRVTEELMDGRKDF